MMSHLYNRIPVSSKTHAESDAYLSYYMLFLMCSEIRMALTAN